MKKATKILAAVGAVVLLLERISEPDADI